MKKVLISVVAFAVLGIAVTPIYADDAHHPKTEAQKSYAVKGEVVAVDKAAGRVKLKHEAVPELDWPAMTMFFPVADKSQLDAVKAGDQVEFQFVKANGGAPLITQIKSVK
ncbi:MAG: cation transporter [Methylophilales bacterium RIFCSPHIGHO2_02_FULL_57_10]|nr:MAG: cation transporter [Methylophilales bacterium RIFCSPHIGHO2_02_FULL_57_10]